MSAYVDPVKPNQPSKSWPFGGSCLLIADGGIAELESYRTRLKLKAAWQRPAYGLKAYLLPPKVRDAAVNLGAISLTDREFLDRVRKIRGDT